MNTRIYLSFLSASGRNAIYITADELAARIRQHGIRTVITNSCQSAAVVGETGYNFAEKLVAAGMSEVLAMSYLCSGAAAQAFFEHFYAALLAQGLSFAAAASTAR